MRMDRSEIKIDGNSNERAENYYSVWRIVNADNGELIFAFYGDMRLSL